LSAEGPTGGTKSVLAVTTQSHYFYPRRSEPVSSAFSFSAKVMFPARLDRENRFIAPGTSEGRDRSPKRRTLASGRVRTGKLLRECRFYNADFRTIDLRLPTTNQTRAK